MSKLIFNLILIFAINFSGYSQQETEIYNKVINCFAIKKNLKPADSNKGVTIVALDKPSNPFIEVTFSRLKESYPKLSEEVFNDFFTKNQMNFKLEKFYSSNFDLVIFSRNDIPDQDMLASKYPKWNHSIIEISNIGFNKDKNEAMVYYGQGIGSRAAGGIYIIYKLKKGKWTQKKVIPSWST